MCLGILTPAPRCACCRAGSTAAAAGPKGSKARPTDNLPLPLTSISILLYHTLTFQPSLTRTPARDTPDTAAASLAPSPLDMQLTVITATGQRHQLDVPHGQLNAAGLQAAVARLLGVQAAGLRLVRAGQPLNEDEAVSKLRDGGELPMQPLAALFRLQSSCIAQSTGGYDGGTAVALATWRLLSHIFCALHTDDASTKAPSVVLRALHSHHMLQALPAPPAASAHRVLHVHFRPACRRPAGSGGPSRAPQGGAGRSHRRAP